MLDPFGLAGQVLDGQFRVDRFIGEGGFSIVYRGHHVGLDEPIAIKCLKLQGTLGSAMVDSFVRRFRDESRLHYRLSQGNLYIARSIASGTVIAPATSALVPYMVLEWLEGRSLADELTVRRVQGLQGRTLPEAVRLLDSAVDAIAYAHAQGVVHRDLSPGNLFLANARGGARLKVLDFGVAKVVSDHALELGPRAQTFGHLRMFSPVYGAPEQFDERLGAIGAWTDVYTLALVLLEVLRDRPVREAEHLGELATMALDGPPSLASLGLSLGKEVEAEIMRALSVSPSNRPGDAGELWGALKNAMQRSTRSVPPPTTARIPLASTLPIRRPDASGVISPLAATADPTADAKGGQNAPANAAFASTIAAPRGSVSPIPPPCHPLQSTAQIPRSSFPPGPAQPQGFPAPFPSSSQPSPSIPTPLTSQTSLGPPSIPKHGRVGAKVVWGLFVLVLLGAIAAGAAYMWLMPEPSGSFRPVPRSRYTLSTQSTTVPRSWAATRSASRARSSTANTVSRAQSARGGSASSTRGTTSGWTSRSPSSA
jgi:serine/threonine-protein kinase